MTQCTHQRPLRGCCVHLGSVTNSPIKYLTTEEISAIAKVPERTLEGWRKTGEGPPWCRLGPRFIRYPEPDFHEWMRSRTYPHRAAELAKASELTRAA